MIKKGFLLASFAIGVFANIFAQDTLSFKKTRDKNIYVEFLGCTLQIYTPHFYVI